MNIAMTHFRVGETDGVSLEMDKWKTVLERNGHTVFYIAGSAGLQDAFIIEEMGYWGKEDARINAACFEDGAAVSTAALQDRIHELAGIIERKFIQIIQDNQIDVLIPNNLLSLGRSPHIAMAITNAALKTKVKVIGHHHDFYWERSYFDHPQSEYVKSLLDTYFPPVQLTDMRHVVINKLAKNDLLSKKGLESTVVPNVFDFQQELWKADAYNQSYLRDMGVGDNEVVFLQATRVTNRKAIELAIELIALLDTPEYRQAMIGKKLYNGKVFDEQTKLTMLMVGLHEGAEGYEQNLVDLAAKRHVNLIVKPELIDHSRKTLPDGSKVYSLWDAYVFCDMITYPSIYEGWGNQFLEGVFAKKPQIVFEYSVFKSDIQAYAFDYISLGDTYTVGGNGMAHIDGQVLARAANMCMAYLFDSDVYQACVDKNFELAKKYLSLEALEKLIVPLMDWDDQT